MVFLAAPVMRTVARMELPSVRQLTIRARWSVLSLFILTIVCLTGQDVKVNLTWQRVACFARMGRQHPYLTLVLGREDSPCQTRWLQCEVLDTREGWSHATKEH